MDVTLDDLQMYYTNTLTYYNNEIVRVRSIEYCCDEIEWWLEGKDNTFRTNDKPDTFLTLLGYFQCEETVVHIDYTPMRSVKKSLYPEMMSYYYPQGVEYDLLNKRLPMFSYYNLEKRGTTPLSEVEDALKTKKAVVIHRNYAIVKKGFSEKLCVYYKKQHIGYYENGLFSEKGSKCAIYIKKLLMEIENWG